MPSDEAALAARVLEAVRDPRPEYAEDSAPWARLLRLVYLVETLNEAEGVAPGPSARDSLFGVLHGFRSGGARLTYDPRAAGGRGGWRLAPRLSPKVGVVDEATGAVERAAGETLWATADEYREDARAFLLPHRSLLGRLLVELPPPGEPGDGTRAAGAGGPAHSPAPDSSPAPRLGEGGAGAGEHGGPFVGGGPLDPARLAYGVARRRGFPVLRLRSGRTFGPGEEAWRRDVGRAEGERDRDALYRVVRHFELGDEDGPTPTGGSPAPEAARAGREEADR
jgi:hypothetical protein